MTSPVHRTLRYRAASDSDGGNSPESEDDDVNPYPLEGKYTNEEDRMRYALLYSSNSALIFR